MIGCCQRKLCSSGIAAVTAWAVIVLAGCGGPGVIVPTKICPGKNSVNESLSVLRSRSQDAVSFKANGQCFAQFDVDGEPRKENFNVKLWVNPPAEIRLQGDVVFNPRGIDLGANEYEFWLAMKPKEIGNSYFWGRWSDGACLEDFAIRPEILLEVLGTARVDSEKNWLLVHEGGFDVLTKCDEQGAIVKKLHISSCDYLVKKIEYFGEDEQVVLVARLEGYKEVSKGFFVAGVIKIDGVSNDGSEETFRITLGSVKAVDFSRKQMDALFNRPEPRGFGHVYKVTGDELVEQL